MTSDDIISPSKTLIWSCGFILQLHHTVDQFRMASAESDSYQSEISGSDNLYMEWRWWRKITRNEWKLRCAVCIWTKSTNSQCGEQQYVAWWYWVGKKVGGGNYWQNLKFKLVSWKFRLVSSFVNALLT